MMAAMCLEIANRMSLDSDRLRLTDRAQQWLELAQKNEAEQLPETDDGRHAGSVQESLESRTQTDAMTEEIIKIADDPAIETVVPCGTPDSQCGQLTSAGEHGSHRPVTSRSPGP